ncbi:MAG: DUF308 domain-containing protein [Lentisphaeria bacterium]|nr:DUF308 domain-containing protein [Lentisphaeria bacterium]
MINELADTCSCTISRWPSRGAMIWRSILTVILGLLLLCRPLLTISVLTIAIGFLLVFDGTWLIAAGFRVPRGPTRTFNLITGLFTLVLGLLAAVMPLLMDLAWVIFLGAWMILDAVGDFHAAWHTPGHRGRLVVSACLSLILGILLVLLPVAGLQAINSIAGVLLLVYGIFLFGIVITTPKAILPVP